jgi:hypothetical protein
MLPPNELGAGTLDPVREAEALNKGVVYAYTMPGLRTGDPAIFVTFMRPPAQVAADIVRFVRSKKVQVAA